MHRYLSLLLLLLPCGAFILSPWNQHPRENPRNLLWSSSSKNKDLSLARSNLTTTTNSNKKDSASSSSALTLQQQARALRAEAESLQRSLQEEKALKLQKEQDKVDHWMQELLVNVTIDENTQMLNTVDQVMQLLRDGRFSQEQVNKMFHRICETGPPQSRSKCSPIMELLVDAAGKLDELEREDNPNKRWSGKVERELRKRLFAMDWGIELEEEETPSDRFI